MRELRVERHGRVGWIVFDRPERLNALTNDMLRALPAAWQGLDADDEVRAIVVTGTGRGFCTGLDVRELADHPEDHAEFSRAAHENRRRFTAVDFGVLKPVICAVNGVCAGGGLHYVVDADIVLASNAARFIDPHVSVGQVSGAESVALRLRLPFGEALRMVLLGRGGALSATRAYELGLVAELAPDEATLRRRAQELAESMAEFDPEVIAAAKRQAWSSI